MKYKSFKFFIFKVLLYCLPVLIICMPIIYLLYISGEFVDLDELITSPVVKSEYFLLGLAYSNPELYFKSRLIIKNKPKIMSIGTSRVLKFRDYFFYNASDFYNGGRTVRNINQYIPFLDMIGENQRIEVLILGLDHCFFNNNWKYNASKYAYKKLFNKKPTAHDVFRSGFFNIYKDLFQKKIDIIRLKRSVKPYILGVSAIMKSDGLRKDGSYSNGFRINNYEKSEDFQFKASYKRIEEGNQRFEYGEEVSEKTIIELENILNYCNKRNIYVISFLPPYAPSVVEKMKAKTWKYSYLWKIANKTSHIFKKYSIPFFDFTDMTKYGCMDKEFIDGLHGSERTYAKIIMEMAKKDQKLKKYVNIKLLEHLISHSKNDFLLNNDKMN